MQRYFLEVTYKGSGYAGFQIQKNANTVQSEIQRTMYILFKEDILLTGSSRTDAGVHALQNFFHFDTELNIREQYLYNLNALLPKDISIRSIIPVQAEAHCRFDAISREYSYHLYQKKNPFLDDRAYYFPYKMDVDKMQQAARGLFDYSDFTSFSKRNTQVKNFRCRILRSDWEIREDQLIYHVQANRFLRGMVRGLTGTMLLVGRGTIDLEEFHAIISSKDCSRANFAVPGHGLFLEKVNYPDGYFRAYS